MQVIMFVSLKCMVFHKQNVVNKRKKRNFDLTKNMSNSDSPDYFCNIKPRIHHLH